MRALHVDEECLRTLSANWGDSSSIRRVVRRLQPPHAHGRRWAPGQRERRAGTVYFKKPPASVLGTSAQHGHRRQAQSLCEDQCAACVWPPPRFRPATISIRFVHQMTVNFQNGRAHGVRHGITFQERVPKFLAWCSKLCVHVPDRAWQQRTKVSRRACGANP
jgi:hypothetical protein